MIRTQRGTGYRLVTVDRPERRNALRPRELDAIEAAVTEAAEPVVLLRGAGTAFCAGADLNVVRSLSDPEAFARHGQRVADSIANADSVVVAGVDGAARGGGVELALACDLRVATKRATFSESGVRLGLFGAWGGTARLPRIVGESDAMDLALSGRVVDAAEAHRMGLVSRVVADPEAVAAELASHPPDALRAIKGRMRDDASQQEQEAREAEAFADLVRAHADDL
jgi:enoyl-CoA hydratase